MDIITIVQLAIILAISIGLHEYAHALVSYTFGDPTPKLQGRLTPNPLKHIDPIGFLMIFLVHFGWGKPVQINPAYYKHPKRDELLVALAGPATNLLLAIAGILILLIYAKISWLGAATLFASNDIFISFWTNFSFINIALAFFNLIPLPPLDGFRLVKIFFWDWASKIEQNFSYVLIALLVIVLSPLGSVITHVSTWVFNFLFMIFGQVFY